MFEALIGPIIGSAVGGMMSGGGSASQTASKEPWEAAAPWLKDLLSQGQGLSSYYQQNPFNPLQQAAYANLFNQSDYLNQAAPGLLAQFSQQQGFDRSNPTARPQAIQFPTMSAMGAQGGMRQMAGLLGADMNVTQNPARNGLLAAAAPPAAPAAAPAMPSFWGVDWKGEPVTAGGA